MKNSWQSLVPDAVLIAFITLIVYVPTLHNGFVFDDAVITDHPVIRARDGLYRIWFTAEVPDYYPLSWSLLWLEWHLWVANPIGYHVFNVVLHTANAVLVWLVLRRLKIPGAWLAGLIFAIHPVNVATAAWVFEQKNTLSMLFFLVAVLCYLEFECRSELPAANGARGAWYFLSLGGFLLALFSKNAVVMLPVVLLGCVWWQRGRVRRKDLLHTVPFFALSLVFGLVNIWFEHHQGTEERAVRTIGVLSRLAGAGWPPWFYLYKALRPINLTVIYPQWEVNPARLISYVPGTILVVCFAFFWWKRHSWGRPLLFGFGYFVVMLVPVLGIVDQDFYRFSLVADHWQYYSIVGVIALAVAVGETSCRRMGERGQRIGLLVSVAIVVSLAAATWTRASVYRDDETLWRDNVTRNPTAWAAHYNLGLVLWQTGKLEDAIRNYRQALRLNPNDGHVHNNLGLALAATGRNEDAITEYRDALRLSPGNAEARVNLGVALARSGQSAQAMVYFYEAVKMKPSLSVAHFTLASALENLGRTEEAAAQYAEGLWLDPNHAAAHNNLAVSLARQGKVADALHHLEEALRLDPDYAEAHNNLGAILLKQGRVEEAIAHFERALSLKPDYPGVESNLQTAREVLGRGKQSLSAP